MKVGLFKFKVFLSTLFIIAGWLAPIHAAGLLAPVNQINEKLQIKSHHVEVTFEDGYIVTQVDQKFSNPHDTDLEALYTFPIPQNGAVAEFSYWIDGKKVTAEVLEKKRAKKIYKKEKEAGRETALTEKTEKHAFEVRVYPVRAKNEVQIRLVYIQPASIDTGMGFYTYPLEDGGTNDLQNAFWTANEQVEESFSFNMKIRSSTPVDGVRVPGYKAAQVNKVNGNEWTVQLQSGQQVAEEGEKTVSAGPAFKLDKDVVVYWRHADNIPGRVDLVTYKPTANGRGTFMLTVTPGSFLNKVKAGKDWVFVLDQSGSMAGKFKTLLNGVEKALSKMSGKDRYRIVFFNNNTAELTKGFQAATAENIRQTIQALHHVGPSGGTNLYDAIHTAMDMLDADRTGSIVLVTDGVANVGKTDQRDFLKLMKKNDVRLFTFIIGNNANNFLLKELTHVSNGFAVSVSNSDDIVGHILNATSKVTHEAFRDVKLKISGVNVEDITTNNSNTLYRGQQLIYFGHYRGNGTAKVRLQGRVSGARKGFNTSFSFPDVSTDHPEIERLWGYAKIEELKRKMVFSDQVSELKQAIIDLSVQTGIVTDYTSMLVVREELFKTYGIDQANKKRLKKEHTAAQKRKQSAVKSNRVDQSQPMFQSNQATHRSTSYSGGGGGALNGWFVLLLVPMLFVRYLRRNS